MWDRDGKMVVETGDKGGCFDDDDSEQPIVETVLEPGELILGIVFDQKREYLRYDDDRIDVKRHNFQFVIDSVPIDLTFIKCFRDKVKKHLLWSIQKYL
jgi:hypothetical protein